MAVVEPRSDLLLWSLTGHADHWTPLDVMHAEMRDAHYRPDASFDFCISLRSLAPARQ